MGPTGCGKSTLLRIITGLQAPTAGEVLYRGAPLLGVNPHATIVFQTFALFPWLTVQENVEVALKARGVPPKIRTTRALDLLDRVGLDGFENAYPRELSGGMLQKVGFARAMAVEPELLCLDEPFSALDVLSAESLRGELLELWTGAQKIQAAIDALGYHVDYSAQCLKTGKSNHIGILTPSIGPYYWAVISWLQWQLNEEGFFSTVFFTRDVNTLTHSYRDRFRPF